MEMGWWSQIRRPFFNRASFGGFRPWGCHGVPPNHPRSTRGAGWGLASVASGPFPQLFSPPFKRAMLWCGGGAGDRMKHWAWWRWWWVAITSGAEESKDLYQRLKNDPAIWGCSSDSLFGQSSGVASTRGSIVHPVSLLQPKRWIWDDLSIILVKYARITLLSFGGLLYYYHHIPPLRRQFWCIPHVKSCGA